MPTIATPIRHSRSVVWPAVAAVLAAVALTGCSTHAKRDEAARYAPASSSAQSSRTTPSLELARSIPIRVDIPAIAAHSSLVQLGLKSDRSVAVPPVSQPLQAGWYKYSPTPGQRGPAVILGHIDGDHQKGVFWRLHEVKPGDTVRVSRRDGTTLSFTVRKVDEIAKSAFPTSAVYGDTPNPQLRLITCGGAFDAANHNYLDNIIVYATMNKAK
jgi:hypothetical protein